MHQADTLKQHFINVKFEVHFFQATPLPYEMMRLQSAITSVVSLMSISFPLAIRLVKQQILSSNPNTTALNNDLDRLTATIEDMNRAMANLNNESAVFSQMIETTEMVVPNINQDILTQLRQSVVNLSQVVLTLPSNMNALFSLVFTLKGLPKAVYQISMRKSACLVF